MENNNEAKGLKLGVGMRITSNDSVDSYVYQDDKDKKLYLITPHQDFNQHTYLEVTNKLLGDILKNGRTTKLEDKELEYCLVRDNLITKFNSEELVSYQGGIFYIKDDFRAISSDKNYAQDKEVSIVSETNEEFNVKVKDVYKSDTEEYTSILYNRYKNPTTKLGVILALDNNTNLQHMFNKLELKEHLAGGKEDLYTYVLEHIAKTSIPIRLKGLELEGLAFKDKHDYKSKKIYVVSEGRIYLTKIRFDVVYSVNYSNIEEDYKVSITPQELYEGLGLIKDSKGLEDSLSILALEDYFTGNKIRIGLNDKFTVLGGVLGDILQTKEGRESNELRNILRETKDSQFLTQIIYLRTVTGLASYGIGLGIKGEDANLTITIRDKTKTKTILTNKEELNDFFQEYYGKVKGLEIDKEAVQRYTNKLIENYALSKGG